MSELRFSATISDQCRIVPDALTVWLASLSELRGQRVDVIVKRHRETRTSAQNRLLWGHVYAEAVADGVDLVDTETGLPVFRTSEDVHGFAKLALLRRPVTTNRGTIDLLGTTTTLTTEEFSNYIELLCAKLASLGVYIPQVGA